MFRVISVLCACLMLSAPMVGLGDQPLDQYLVIGSFNREAGARLDGERLADRMDLPIYLQESGSLYRLLTPVAGGAVEMDAGKRRFAAAGIQGVWSIWLDESVFLEPLLADIRVSNESPFDAAETEGSGLTEAVEEEPLMAADLAGAESRPVEVASAPGTSVSVRPTAGRYLVAGAFGLEENAAAAMNGLGPLASSAFLQPVFADNQSFYRILIGPLSAGQENEWRAQLASLGIRGAWVVQSGGSDLMTTAAQSAGTGSAMPSVSPTTAQPGLPPPKSRESSDQAPVYASDFNLARMRREPDGP